MPPPPFSIFCGSLCSLSRTTAAAAGDAGADALSTPGVSALTGGDKDDAGGGADGGGGADSGSDIVGGMDDVA